MNAVDTNVLLYSLDASEPTKRPIAQTLLRDLRASSEKTVLPWQVLCEVTAQLRTWTVKKRISAEVATNYIQSFRGIFPIKTPRAVDSRRGQELETRARREAGKEGQVVRMAGMRSWVLESYPPGYQN